MTDGENDNEAGGEEAAVVLAFPTEIVSRRRLERFRLTHHDDGSPLSADELADALETAAIMSGVEALVELAFERAGDDYEMASIMLLHSVQVMDRNALIDRADRILGPRRGTGGRPGPEAA